MDFKFAIFVLLAITVIICMFRIFDSTYIDDDEFFDDDLQGKSVENITIIINNITIQEEGK